MTFFSVHYLLKSDHLLNNGNITIITKCLAKNKYYVNQLKSYTVLSIFTASSRDYYHVNSNHLTLRSNTQRNIIKYIVFFQ